MVVCLLEVRQSFPNKGISDVWCYLDVNIDLTKVGCYKVSFHNAFLDSPPAVVVGQCGVGNNSSTLDNATLLAVNAGSFSCKTGDDRRTGTNRDFSFIAIGTTSTTHSEVTVSGLKGYVWCALSQSSGVRICTVSVPRSKIGTAIKFNSICITNTQGHRYRIRIVQIP